MSNCVGTNDSPPPLAMHHAPCVNAHGRPRLTRVTRTGLYFIFSDIGNVKCSVDHAFAIYDLAEELTDF